MTLRIPKWVLFGLGGLVAIAGIVVAVVVVTGGEDSGGCVSSQTGNPISCEQDLIAVPAGEYDPDLAPSEQPNVAASEATNEEATTAEVASPDELTSAFGEISGVCILTTSLGTPLDYKDIAKIRENLEILTDTAAIDPEAPTADPGFTVRDSLFDLVGQMKGCDDGLEAELQHAIDALP